MFLFPDGALEDVEISSSLLVHPGKLGLVRGKDRHQHQQHQTEPRQLRQLRNGLQGVDIIIFIIFHYVVIFQIILIWVVNIPNITADLDYEGSDGVSQVTADLVLVDLQAGPQPLSHLTESLQVSWREIPPADQDHHHPSHLPTATPPSCLTWNSVAPGWRTWPGWRWISGADSSSADWPGSQGTKTGRMSFDWETWGLAGPTIPELSSWSLSV